MLDNLKPLVADMRRLGWIIDGFPFSFKQHNYFVLVILYQDNEETPPYALAKLQFIDSQNTDRKYIVHANSRDFIDLDVKSFREFFNILYGDGVGDAIQNLKKALGSVIPTEFNQNKNHSIQSNILNYLNKSDPQNPNKIYCTGVKRNQEGNFRTDFNDNKARLLVPKVYDYFKDDKTLSFCFSENSNDEKDEKEIISNFLAR